ncbi:hypothetical protein SSBR45G_05050 [Bradyrhizobium sp. SSBR45G]|uniref:hypothetical protein n=1 Tax=unclassified Bradyrhizobium TaxID=2631580 RepID=UPI002342A2A7|nr:MULTISPECIES: hypothetical protein [unclassified Bradyrhizobium]GLH75597.1 hypothetical protein SSBR45G_05050 [Bradyrhizobium sp. SSBR45G]GLH82613.1 hypothetical protein SSBR45R_00730 [Bradyrhizobium sp. SSBR45R]
MEYIRFAVKFASIAVLVALASLCAYLVMNGDIPAPDIEAIGKKIAPSLAVGASVALVLVIAVCAVLTAVAPFVFAARSGDIFTIVVSVVALVLCFTLLINSRTVVDQVLAGIIYLTSALVSVVMYSTKVISRTR